MLSHTERFCRKKLEGSEGEISKEWGQWLRAPPRKMAGSNRSKWLREEGDGEWRRKEGKDNYEAENQGFQNTGLARPTTNLHIRGDNADKSGYVNADGNNLRSEAGKSKVDINNGLDSEELYGLNLEERKRQRIEAQFTNMQTK